METLFNGKYKTISLIAKGGMSKVYLAESTSLGTKWAIKAVDKKLNVEFDLLAEPNILKKLNHPALPRIIDIEEDSKNIYIIEDYIDGKSLDKRLKEEKKIDEKTLINWAKELCDVLIYLHNQVPNPIIYRDMKPANIIITKENKVKLIDFGIAREFKIENNSDTVYMGTRGYAAPEQYGSNQTDRRTDIYSLGVTMYHLVTGKSPNEAPYEFKPIRQIDPNLSEGLEYILNKCIQNDPQKRYQSVEELLYDLENIHTFNTYYIKYKKKQKIKNILKASMVAVSIGIIFLGAYTMGKEKEGLYNNLISSGDNYLNQLQFDEAEKSYKQAQDLIKDNTKAYIRESNMILKKSGAYECINYLNEKQQNVKEITENAEYHYILGSAYFDNQQYDKAKESYSNAVELDNENINYLRDYGVANARVGEITKAQNIIDSLLKTSNYEDSVQYINGEIQLYQENTYESIKSFEEVIKITDDEELKRKSYISISDIYKKNRASISNSKEKQIELLKNAQSDLKNKDDVYIIESLGEVYHENEEYKKSKENFSKLLDLGYNRPYIYRNLAIACQMLKDFDQAENILLTMKDKYPDEYTCYLQLGFLNIEIENKKPQSVRDYKKVLEYYNLAVKYAPEGENTSDVIILGNYIRDLKSKEWI